ncbi:MAG: OmpA family protein [Saprospiraceae bacterium]
MRPTLYCLILLIGLSACVSRQKYDVAQQKLAFYQERTAVNDSLRYTPGAEAEDPTEVTAEIELRQRMQQLERLTATNMSLNASYQDLLKRYNDQLDQNRDVLQVSGNRVTDLESAVAQREAEISRKEQELGRLDIELDEREAEINRIGGSGGVTTYDSRGGSASSDPIRTRVVMHQQRLNEVRARLLADLTAYGRGEVDIYETPGAVTIQLGDGLLFPGAPSLSIGNRGRQAVRQIANTLRLYNDLDVIVTGHTDGTGSPTQQWELSTERAVSVVNLLIDFGFSGQRLTAAGQSGFQPLMNGSTPENRVVNRRTTITVMPKYEMLYGR